MASNSKAILISGGAQGIGRCLARTLLKKGHRVYILDIKEDELNYTVNSHLKPYHPRVGSSICNLRSVESIRESVDAAAKFFGGRIDVLINNGGIAHPYWKDGKSMDAKETIDQWQAYIETNLTAPFAVSQACIPYMSAPPPPTNHMINASESDDSFAEAGPSIIHIGSFRARQSDPNQEGYASTKAGLLGLTQSQAISLSRFGIRVNLIAPGRIKATHECRDGDEKGLTWAIEAEDDVEPHATNRPGKPEDIAKAVMFLMESGFVTGVDVTVDGGALVQKNEA